MRITKKKIAAVVATTAVVALGAGAAFAFVTNTSGTGTGTANVSAKGAWLVTVDAGDQPLTLDEKSSYAVHVKNNGVNPALLVDLEVVPVTLDANGFIAGTGCKPAWFTPIVFNPNPDGTTVAGGATLDTVLEVTFENSLTEDQTACLGASILFDVKAS